MNNLDVKTSMVLHGLKQWQIAEAIGYSESYFSRLMRNELPENFKKALIDVIEKIAANEVPDLSYFEQQRYELIYQRQKKKSIAKERRIDRALHEIEERRILGEWGL